MVLKFLLLLFPAILLYIPMAFYKKTGNCMTAFYYRMAFSENTRKFYMLTLLIMLLLFHYLHHSVMNDIVTLIPSTALSMCLFSYRLTDSMFYLINSRLRMFVAILLAMILATVFCHGMFPFVVTLGFFLNASIFYPSKKIAVWLKMVCLWMRVSSSYIINVCSCPSHRAASLLFCKVMWLPFA